jgi:hypothetical protein
VDRAFKVSITLHCSAPVIRRLKRVGSVKLKTEVKNPFHSWFEVVQRRSLLFLDPKNGESHPLGGVWPTKIYVVHTREIHSYVGAASTVHPSQLRW